ncbi:MAG: POTRA domain-containing protein, partial [Gammaproteobacteria bacterium]
MNVNNSTSGDSDNRRGAKLRWAGQPWFFTVVACCLLVSTQVFAEPVTVQLDVDNLNSQQKNSVLESISLYRQRNSLFLTDDYINRLFQRGKQEISTTMQVYGFYKVKVDGRLERDESKWRAIYKVESGPDAKIRQVDIDIRGDGSSDEKLREWAADYPLKSGDTLNHLKYEQAKNKLQSILSVRGYFKSKLIKHQIQISREENYSNIVLHVDTGPRHRFGDV